jgi:hypothetical protein
MQHLSNCLATLAARTCAAIAQTAIAKRSTANDESTLLRICITRTVSAVPVSLDSPQRMSGVVPTVTRLGRAAWPRVRPRAQLRGRGEERPVAHGGERKPNDSSHEGADSGAGDDRPPAGKPSRKGPTPPARCSPGRFRRRTGTSRAGASAARGGAIPGFRDVSSPIRRDRSSEDAPR